MRNIWKNSKFPITKPQLYIIVFFDWLQNENIYRNFTYYKKIKAFHNNSRVKQLSKCLYFFLYLLSFSNEIFGFEVLYENGTEEHCKIVENFEKLHYFFVYGYSSVFGESFFSNNQSYELMNNEIPILYIGYNTDNFILNATNTELDGVWTEKITNHLIPFDSKWKSGTKQKAIVLPS